MLFTAESRYWKTKSPDVFFFLPLTPRYNQYRVLREQGMVQSREGWPLLTAETEAMGTQGVHMQGILPCLVHRDRCAGTIYFCPAFTSIVCPSTKYFSLPYPFLLQLSPSPSKLGRQSCCVACLLICESGAKSQKEEGGIKRRRIWGEIVAGYGRDEVG